MKKLAKLTLLCVVLVLCLVGVYAMAASAATPFGDTTQTDAHAASITYEGITYYYETLDDALFDARANDLKEIVLLKNDAAVTNADVQWGHDITIKGASADIALDLPFKAFVLGDSSLAFENLKLTLTGDAIYCPEFCKVNLSFKNVVMDLTSNYSIEFLPKGVNANITLIDCEINHSSPSDTAYLAYVPNSITTFNVSNLKTNAAICYGDANTMLALNLGNVTKTTTYPLVRGTAHTVFGGSFADDAAAKMAGCKYRVGETANGKLSTIYFVNKNDALVAATAGVKVYDITGATPTEVANTCEHNYADIVTPPTCTKVGFTTHTCTKCGGYCIINETPVVAHVDANNDYKCDACEISMGTPPATDTDDTTSTDDTTTADTEVTTDTEASTDTEAATVTETCIEKTDTPESSETAPADDEGCGSVIGGGAVVLVSVIGSAAVFVTKRKEN